MSNIDCVNVRVTTKTKDISVTEFLKDCEELMDMATRLGCLKDFTDMTSEEFETLKAVTKCYKDLREFIETWAASVNEIKNRQARIEESLKRIESKLDK